MGVVGPQKQFLYAGHAGATTCRCRFIIFSGRGVA